MAKSDGTNYDPVSSVELRNWHLSNNIHPVLKSVLTFTCSKGFGSPAVNDSERELPTCLPPTLNLSKYIKETTLPNDIHDGYATTSMIGWHFPSPVVSFRSENLKLSPTNEVRHEHFPVVALRYSPPETFGRTPGAYEVTVWALWRSNQ